MAANGTDQRRSALVAYGTETGTAQDLTEELGKTLQNLHFAVEDAGLESVLPDELAQFSLCVFVVSTTGQGDFPYNARLFWTGLLRKRLPRDFLADVNYVVVGLGDSSYPKFNWAARKLAKRLKQLGAREIVEACEADEQDDEGTDGVFLEWLDGFKSSISTQYPLQGEMLQQSKNSPSQSRWQLSNVSTLNGIKNFKDFKHQAKTTMAETRHRMTANSVSATLQTNDRVTPASHWQDVRLFRLVTSQIIDYRPGDAVEILPKNAMSNVDALVGQMQWQEIADLPVQPLLQKVNGLSMSRRSKPSTWPMEHTLPSLRDLLFGHLDITAIPRRSFFSKIANYTTNESHKERLLEFTDPKYLDEYYDYATRPRRSILEVLQEFDSVKIPWQEAINVFPPLRPRQFSIASGGALRNKNRGGTTIELLVAIVKYKTVIKKIREGVCTRYLADLPVGSMFDITLRSEGRFYPKNDIAQHSQLLIGAGTGVAPLRALIHEKHDFDPRVDGTLMVFGCRNERADYFFQDEWSQLQHSCAVNGMSQGLHVVPAFSRDQKEKMYVQDRIREHATTIMDYLCQKRATVIVCGSSGQMPKAVRVALVDVLLSARGHLGDENLPTTRDESEVYLAAMEKDGRYKQETW